MRALHQPLMAAGLVPPNCRLMHISIGVSGALMVQFEVYLDASQLVTLGTVFQEVGTAIVDRDRQVRTDDDGVSFNLARWERCSLVDCREAGRCVQPSMCLLEDDGT